MSSLMSQGLNAFVDISHHNTQVDLATAKGAGLKGFFHKATQGVGFTDPAYGDRIGQGRNLGLLLGAYHFGTAETVTDQVSAFLAQIEKYGGKGIVPVLDWEPNPEKTQGTMTKDNAIEFIETFHNKTGVYPMVYGGYWMLLQLAGEQGIDTFAKTPLWQAFYSAAFGYLDGIWTNWSFLQYTDGTLGPQPHEIEGIGKVDRDTFNGSYEDAVNFWKQNGLQGNSC